MYQTHHIRKDSLQAGPQGLLWVTVLMGLLSVSFAPAVFSATDSPVPASNDEVINIPVTVTGSSPGNPFNIPRAIFCDQVNNETYVADAGAGQILIFDQRGWPVYRFTHWVDGPNGRRVGEPNSVVATASGNIFIIDGLASTIDILDYRGRQLFDIDPADFLPPNEDQRLAPTLTLGPLGHVHTICKSGEEHYLLSFDQDGQFLTRAHLGRSSQLKMATGLDVGTDRIVVTDMDAEFSVQIFNRHGKRLKAFGQHDAGWGNFSFPSGVTVTPDGDIWVSDMIRQIVNRFDENGVFLDFIGGRGEGPGSMAYPISVTHNAQGMIVVLEKVGARYQVFEVKKEVEPTSN